MAGCKFQRQYLHPQTAEHRGGDSPVFKRQEEEYCNTYLEEPGNDVERMEAAERISRMVIPKQPEKTYDRQELGKKILAGNER